MQSRFCLLQTKIRDRSRTHATSVCSQNNLSAYQPGPQRTDALGPSCSPRRLPCIFLEIRLCRAVSHTDWHHSVEYQLLLRVANHTPVLLLSMITTETIATRQFISPSYHAEAECIVVLTPFPWREADVWSTLATLSPRHPMLNAQESPVLPCSHLS